MLAALCMAIVLTIALASYLALCFTSLAMSTRNVVGVHSRELAEAGIEQAMYASNTGDTTGWTVSGTTMSATMTMTSSGLVATSSNPTPFNFGNGATGVVNITVNYSPGPPQYVSSITSQGVVSIPAGSMVSAATPTISNTLTYIGPGSSGTASAPVFVNAVAAIRGTTSASGKIKFSNGGLVDSYNSNPSVANLNNGAICVVASLGTMTNANWTAIGAPSNPVAYSPNPTPLGTRGTTFTASGPAVGTGTVYEDYNPNVINVANPGYNINEGYSAVLASQDVAATAATVAIKSAVIQGYVTGYNYPSPSSTNWLSYVANAGKVIGPATPSSTYIDTSRVLTSPVPYLPLPPENISSLTNTVNYTNQTTLGTPGTTTTIYQAGSGFTLGSGSLINVQGPVIIISFGDIKILGTGEIYLSTPSASLQIFEEYGNISIGGNGIQNLNSISTTGIPPLPKRVALLDTTNSWGTVTISTTSPFYGVIYFPYMPVTVSSSATIYGAIVGSSVTFSGASPALHYDLALRNPDSAVGDAAFAYLTAPLPVGSLVASVP